MRTYGAPRPGSRPARYPATTWLSSDTRTAACGRRPGATLRSRPGPAERTHKPPGVNRTRTGAERGSGLPPLAGSKKPMPNRRWNTTSWNARPIICVAVSVMRDVAIAAQTMMGMRKAVIPLARMRSTVAIRLSPPRMDDQLRQPYAQEEHLHPQRRSRRERGIAGPARIKTAQKAGWRAAGPCSVGQSNRRMRSGAGRPCPAPRSPAAPGSSSRRPRPPGCR